MQEEGPALRELLVETQEELQTALAAADRASAWEIVGPNNEGWSVRQLLVHLATSEAGFATTAERMARGEGAMPPDFDPNRWNAGQQRRRAETSIAELRSTLEESHRRTLEQLDRLDAETLRTRRGYLSTGQEGSLADLLRLLATHKRGHTADIEAALSQAGAVSA